MTQQNPTFRSGHVAVVGRPNVGKSSLINALLGERLCIVSPKPQTTRHRVLGVVTREQGQIGYLDTPGMHVAGTGKALNRQLNRTAAATLAEADVNVHVVEALRFDAEDRAVRKAVLAAGRPCLLAINKIDTIKDKGALLPFIAEHGGAQADGQGGYGGVFLVSARRRDGLQALEEAIIQVLPEQEALYDADTLTDRSERFLAAELVREQLMRQLGQELPYATTVEIEQYTLEGRLRRIHAGIWVEREGQKAIVIGAKGARLREIGTQARLAMERLFDGKVHLELWVKVRSGWSDDERALREMGIGG
ncbi:MAG: GTPase Era [Xanthomonadales bacterium]|nr:GTPase Era [Xanthomonadales bacterium]